MDTAVKTDTRERFCICWRPIVTCDDFDGHQDAGNERVL